MIMFKKDLDLWLIMKEVVKDLFAKFLIGLILFGLAIILIVTTVGCKAGSIKKPGVKNISEVLITDPVLLHSHNDYWNTNQFWDGIERGCVIIEIDVIYRYGLLYLGHSWRPFPGMYYGDLAKYFAYASEWRGKPIYLYIDIKNSGKYLAEELVSYMYQYHNERVTFLIGASHEEDMREVREVYRLAKMFYKIKIELWDEFGQGKNIKRVDLYKDQPWYKRLNHF